MERQPAPSTAPISYDDWCVWVDALEAGSCDAELIRLASLSRTTWTAAVAKLFARRAHDALNARLNRVGSSLQRRLSDCRDEASISLALVHARRSLHALGEFADLDVFPDALREALGDLVRHHVRARQEALEKSARADRTGRLALALRRSPLDQRGPVQPFAARAPAAAPTGRRIILDHGS